MKKIIFGVISFLLCSFAQAAEVITSPNGNIQVEINNADGKVTYSVTLNGTTFIEQSPLGLKLNYIDLSEGLALANVETKQMDESYSVPTIKKRNVHYVANAATYSFTKDGKKALDIEFRVSDTDVAFRYFIHQPERQSRFAAVVTEEVTGFTIAQGATTYLCPQMQPMTGFAGTAPSYETHPSQGTEMGNNGWGDGFVFPCLFKVVKDLKDSKDLNDPKVAKDLKAPTDGWLLISETGTNGNYCGCHLENISGNQYKIAFPNPKECNGNGTSAPGLSLPCHTPWRTITLGATPQALVETTVATDLVEPQYEASKEFTYGRGVWSWIIKMDSSCNYDEQKRYIDFAAEMGYESILIDALWDTQIGRDKMEELVKYAASKNVGVFLWYNSNGYWNHAPQGPFAVMHRATKRTSEFRWLKKIGVRGMKIDFFGGDKQQQMQLYEDILSDANDAGLIVIFHGCTLPRGWERMYPNFLASEAVRASENLHFSQGECDTEALYATMHPFCRNAVASMDWGGSTLNKFYGANNDRGSQRRTSDVFALAAAVLFQSPVQHFAMAPNNLQDAPAWAIDFMKRVPTQWDEIKYIAGEPDKYVILARKAANNGSTDGRWIITGINAQEETLTTTLPLDFLGKETVKVYSDNESLEGSVKEQKLNKKRQLKVSIPKNGGLVIE